MPLKRVLGFWDLVFFYTVTSFAIRWIATAAASGPSALVVWVIGAIGLFVPLVFAVLELSTRWPEEGGLYVWTRKTFGDFAGFFGGWCYWASNVPYFPALLYFTAICALSVGGGDRRALEASAAYVLVFSLVVLAIATALNIRGLEAGRWLHDAAAVAIWLPALFLVAAGAIAFFRGSIATPFAARDLLPGTRLKDVVFWSTIAFAFGGVESASFLSAEIRDVRRNLPRALLLAGGLITVVYLLATAAVLVLVPPSEVGGLTGVVRALDAASRAAGVPWALPLCAALLTLNGAGVVGAWLAATARLPFVAGLDRFLPPAFGRLHPRWGTPHVALLVQSALSALFILMSQAGTSVKGAYEALVSVSVIVYFVPFLFLFAAWVRVQRSPAPEGTMRPPGGRPAAVALGVLGFVTTAVSIALALLPPDDAPDKTGAVARVAVLSLVVFVAGYVIWALSPAARRVHDQGAR